MLWGTDDAWIPAERGEKLAGLIPGATLRRIGGAGHLHYDAPVELMDHLRVWLEALASPQMALLSRMFRTVAITGRTDTINAWFADRQGRRWAEQTVRGASPTSPHAPRASRPRPRRHGPPTRPRRCAS